jgi:excisionase family DNA binding protein
MVVMKQDQKPTMTEIEAAKQLSRLFAQKDDQTSVKVGTTEVQLPSGLVQLMLEVMTQIARGQRVQIIPKNMDLTTAETADLLNVSRPYVVQLLSEGKLPFHMVGSHRRVSLEDALEFKAKQREISLQIMRELASEAQTQGYGY